MNGWPSPGEMAPGKAVCSTSSPASWSPQPDAQPRQWSGDFLRLSRRQIFCVASWMTLQINLCWMPLDSARYCGNLALPESSLTIDWSRSAAVRKRKSFWRGAFARPAHLLLWDEPLNYLDIDSRLQLEELIRTAQPTMIFVEHDRAFCEAVATKSICLGR